MKVGKLELIIGPMFSGKSSELYRMGKTRLAVLDDESKILLINSAKDSERYDNKNVITTHDKHSIKAVMVVNLLEILQTKIYDNAEVILIDEGQFFDDLIMFVSTACDIHHKHIIIAGLDGDYKQNKFGQILDLIPHADTVTKVSALCKICKDGVTAAPFTCRITNEKGQSVVGAGDKYIAVCRVHKIEYNEKREIMSNEKL